MCRARAIGKGREATHRAVDDVAAGVQDELVGDDLDVARLQHSAQVEVGVLSDGSKRPA